MTAVQVGVHEFESNFVYSSAPQQNLAAYVPHPNRNIHVRVRSDAQRIFFQSCAAAQADLAYCER